MSAYTERSGEREKHKWSTFVNLRSNQRWMLMTGIPSSSLSCAKCGISPHCFGIMRFMTSTGIAEMYSSASMMSPFAMAKCLTEPSSLSTNSFRRCFM